MYHIPLHYTQYNVYMLTLYTLYTLYISHTIYTIDRSPCELTHILNDVDVLVTPHG